MNIFLKLIYLPDKFYKFIIFISLLLISYFNLKIMLYYFVLVSLMIFLSEFEFFNKYYNKEIYLKKLYLILFFLSISDSIFRVLNINYHLTELFSLNSIINILLILVIGILSKPFEKNT